MSATPVSHLSKIGACSDALEWVKDGKFDSLEAAWLACDNTDWLLWYIGRKAGSLESETGSKIVLIACECAELVLPIFENKFPNDDRPRKAIEAARAYALRPSPELADAAWQAEDAAAWAALSARKAWAAWDAGPEVKAKCVAIIKSHFPTLPK